MVWFFVCFTGLTEALVKAHKGGISALKNQKFLNLFFFRKKKNLYSANGIAFSFGHPPCKLKTDLPQKKTKKTKKNF